MKNNWLNITNHGHPKNKSEISSLNQPYAIKINLKQLYFLIDRTILNLLIINK